MDLDFQPENAPPKPEKFGAPPPLPTSPIASAPAHEAVPMVGSQPKLAQTPIPPTVNHQSAPQSPFVPSTSKKSKLPLLIGLVVFIVIVFIIVFFVIKTRQKAEISTSSSTATTLTTQPSFNDESSATTSTGLSSGSVDTSSSSSRGGSTIPSTTTPSGRDAQRKEDIRKISTLLSAYYADNKIYPVSGELDKLNLSTSIVAKALVPKYVTKLPVDPLDPDFFYAYKSSDGKTYEISARIEDSTDSDATLIGSKYLFIIKK